MTPLQKRLQALETRRTPSRAAENAQIDATIEQLHAMVALMPAAPGDLRTPEQRMHDALFSDTESAEETAMLDALMGALPSLGMTPALWRSLMDEV